MTEKRIKGTYSVADCETLHDIDRAKDYLSRINGIRVISSYWDGRDCGTAYIKFDVAESQFANAYSKLCCSASFDEDINNYVKFDYKAFSAFLSEDTIVGKRNLRPLVKRLSEDLKMGFYDNLPIRLFFEERECNKVSNIEIVQAAMKALGKAKLIGFYSEIVDGSMFHTFYFKANYKDIDMKKIKAFGNYCLGNSGTYLGNNRIYGELAIEHTAYRMFNDFEYFCRFIKHIEYRLPLTYSGYFMDKNVIVTADEYMNGDTFKIHNKGANSRNFYHPIGNLLTKL